MAEWKDEIRIAAQDRWPTRTGLVLALLLAAVTLISTFAGLNLADVSAIEWGVVVAVCVGISTVWLTTRFPRTPKGKVGFGIAIEFENSEHAKRIRSDLVVALRELVAASEHFRHQFHFTEFSHAVARTITDSTKADRIMRRANVRFLVFGRARLRTLPSGPSHLLDLHCMVGHAPIEDEQRKQFSQDLGAVFPGRVVMGVEGDTFTCEFAARHLDAVARYIIGTAAALSNDFVYAEQLLLDAERRLQQYVQNAEGTPVSVLLNKVRTRIVELYQEWLARLSRRHVATRSLTVLQEQEAVIRKLRRYEPDDYSTHLAAAMQAFLLRRDLATARQEIRACSGSRDATWRYSEAFLFAYEGDIDSAYRSYRHALESPLSDPTVPTQCEEFIHNVLEEEPERTWLYYCLGFINHRAKGDLMAARADFRRFVDEADPVRFQRQMAFVQHWIDEIDAVLSRVSQRTE